MEKALKTKPITTAMRYEKAIIAIFLFHFLVFLSNTTNPSPEFAQSPAKQEPKLIPPIKKVSVITTEEAQFGIKPIAEVKKGCKNKFFCINAEKASSPTSSIKYPSKKLTRKINPATFNACNIGVTT